MQVAKVELPGGEQRVAVLVENGVYIVAWSDDCRSLTDLLHAENPVELVSSRFDSNATLIAAPQVRMLALVISPRGKLVGFTVGNDMSARDIEGENPLYLPQAKLYNNCCALGPCILIPEEPIKRAGMLITLVIHRKGSEVFRGQTNLDQM